MTPTEMLRALFTEPLLQARREEIVIERETAMFFNPPPLREDDYIILANDHPDALANTKLVTTQAALGRFKVGGRRNSGVDR